jgi:hypothetical protein
MQTTDYAAIQAARKFAAEQLVATHPHLAPAGNNSLVAAAKNIRTELALAFPSTKFSVKSRRFSGGDSIDVSWTDGPTTSQVDPIINRYSAGSFDGMTDSYNYEHCAWTDAFGDAKYVHSHRDYSARAIAGAIRTVYTRYAGNLEAIAMPSAEDFNKGRLWAIAVPYLNTELQALINVEISRRTWAIERTAGVQK